MDQTKDIIIKMCHLPISIIIIGIGEDSFEKMQELDSDDKVLTNSKGKPAMRDIVQFVKFNDFRNNSSEALAEEVLKEVPT